jgi:hypothetical protein
MTDAESPEERQARFDWIKRALAKLAQEYQRQFPSDQKGSWKYFVFNTIRWE